MSEKSPTTQDMGGPSEDSAKMADSCRRGSVEVEESPEGDGNQSQRQLPLNPQSPQLLKRAEELAKIVDNKK